MKLPLEGLRVVALEQAVAAPFCTSRLCDAGAQVIKIERPDGDFARGYDDAAKGQSSYFVWLNRGKESVVLDLKNADARQELEAFLASADVLVQNLKPGVLRKLGFDIARLRVDYPRLICCSISGFGDDGPLAERKAYDLLVQAEAGLCSITGSPHEPARVGISVVDIATGATAHSSILEALIARASHGHGADIRISMFDVIADWMSVPLLNAEAGKMPTRIGLAHISIAPYGVFRSRDDRAILISIQNEREWQIFSTKILCAPELAVDPRFSTNVARVQNRAETDRLVQKSFRLLDRSELIDRLTLADIAFADLNDMLGLSRHPHLRRVELNTEGGIVSIPAPAPLVDGAIRVGRSVPRLGENSHALRSTHRI